MKTFIGACITFAVLVASVFVYSLFLERETKTILALGENLVQEAEAERWDAAAQAFAETEQAFSKVKAGFLAFADHDALDRMEERLVYIKMQLALRDKTALRGEWAVLKLILTGQRDSVRLKWYNIL